LAAEDLVAALTASASSFFAAAIASLVLAWAYSMAADALFASSAFLA